MPIKTVEEFAQGYLGNTPFGESSLFHKPPFQEDLVLVAVENLNGVDQTLTAGKKNSANGFYYLYDGTYLGCYGNKNEVVVCKARIPHNEGKKPWLEFTEPVRLNMTNEELNLRAFLTTLKYTEAGRANARLDYNTWNNGKNFTEDSYLKNPDAYKEHPGANPDGGQHGGRGMPIFEKIL